MEEEDLARSYRQKVQDLFREAPELPPDVWVASPEAQEALVAEGDCSHEAKQEEEGEGTDGEDDDDDDDDDGCVGEDELR